MQGIFAIEFNFTCNSSLSREAAKNCKKASPFYCLASSLGKLAINFPINLEQKTILSSEFLPVAIN